ncbi:MAG: HAMP domain-containing protein [Comamonadaceae bacterium]|nr:MAG: HAMP domain-containing protein [Comamonadaceae bacterium]
MAPDRRTRPPRRHVFRLALRAATSKLTTVICRAGLSQDTHLKPFDSMRSATARQPFAPHSSGRFFDAGDTFSDLRSDASEATRHIGRASAFRGNEEKRMLKRLRTGQKMAVGFGAVLVLLTAMSGFSLLQMRHLEGQLNDIVDVNMVEQQLAMDMRSAANQMAILNRDVLLQEDMNQLQATRQALVTVNQVYDTAETRLREMFETSPSTLPEESRLMKLAEEARKAAQPKLDQATQLALNGRKIEAAQLLQGPALAPQLGWIQSLSALAEEENNMTRDTAAQAQASLKQAIILTTTLAITAILMGIAAAWGLSRSITRPLAKAVDMTEALARGELGTRAQVDSRDEVGQLLGAMNRMADSLCGVVHTVRLASDSIATGSREIAAGNIDLSQRTEAQAASLQQTAASMEELTSTVRSNADTARLASQLALSASTVAGRGGEVVGQVVDTMQSITASSRKIGDIISVVDGIAFQTNILALNAAVEAARAGEQGRGFAVVAGEVRVLAGRSADASRQIRQLIDASVKNVESGAHLVSEAGSTMTDIVKQVHRVADLMGEITAATEEQTLGIAQVSAAVQQLDYVTQQNAALVEESAAAAGSLRDQSSRLVQSVASFQLTAPSESANSDWDQPLLAHG